MSVPHSGAAELPEGLEERHLARQRPQAYAREMLLLLLGLIVIAALFGAFGQRPGTSVAEGAAGRLEVSAPTRLRGGVLFEARLTVAPRRDLRRARLVLAPGWLEGLQINSITPEPVAQRTDDGGVVFQLGRIPAGGKLVTVMQFQVNPTNVGRRSQDVRLEAEGLRPLEVRRTVTVYP